MGIVEKASRPHPTFLPLQPKQQHRRRISLPCTPPETPLDFSFFSKSTTVAHNVYPTGSPPLTPTRPHHQRKASAITNLPLAYHVNCKPSNQERRFSTQHLYALARHTTLTPTKAIYLFFIIFSATYLASFVPIPAFLRLTQRQPFIKPPYYHPTQQPLYAGEKLSEAERRAWAGYRQATASRRLLNERDALQAINIDSDIIRSHPEAYYETPSRRRVKMGMSVGTPVRKEENGKEPLLPPPGAGPLPIVPARRPLPGGGDEQRRKQAVNNNGAGPGMRGRQPVMDSSEVVMPDPRDEKRKVMRGPWSPPLERQAPSAPPPPVMGAAKTAAVAPPPPPHIASVAVPPKILAHLKAATAAVAAPSAVVVFREDDEFVTEPSAEDEDDSLLVEAGSVSIEVKETTVLTSDDDNATLSDEAAAPDAVSTDEATASNAVSEYDDESMAVPPPPAAREIKRIMLQAPKGGFLRRPAIAGLAQKRITPKRAPVEARVVGGASGGLRRKKATPRREVPSEEEDEGVEVDVQEGTRESEGEDWGTGRGEEDEGDEM